MKTFPRCQIEDSFFTLSRLIVSGSYNVNFFTRTEMLAYLDLCRIKHSTYGTSTAGHNSFIKKFQYIKPEKYKQIIRRLIDNRFITVDRKAGKITYLGLLFPPLIDELSQEILSMYPDIYMNTFYINVKRHNYIRLPKGSFLDIVKNLTLKEIYVLMKLYRYNNLYTFGGCEDSVISNTNGFFLHENFYKDMYLLQHEAIDIINKIIKEGLASWVQVVKKETVIDGRSYYFYVNDFNRFKGSVTSRHRTEVVLRLCHQPPLIKEDDDV